MLKICVCLHVELYIAMTKDLLKNSYDRLMVSSIAPYAGVSIETIRRWGKHVMAEAGIFLYFY